MCSQSAGVTSRCARQPQDVLHHQRHQGGVLGIVVERVAGGDALDHQAGRLVDDLGVDRLASAEGRR